MRTALITLACILSLTAEAQMLQRQVVGSAGTLLSKGDMRIASTAGEAFIGLKSVSGTQVIIGFHAQATVDNVGVQHDLDRGTTISAYPNPFSDVITISSEAGIIPDRLHLYSSDGRLVRSVAGSGTLSTIDLAGGYYILQVSFSDNRTQRIPLFKQ
ncbi:MAG: T9SS type A sorting domain-containing protein [Flavobacteriales bacterium]|nr:T9SS type A sorting domain-containing protein [Flavobacteriales bacterium]